LREWNLYGTSLFVVKQNKKPNIGWLAINQKGLDLLSYPSMKLLRSWPITSISSWSLDNNSFNFVSGSLFKPNREHFISSEAVEMCNVLRAYITYLTALATPSNTHQAAPSPTRAKLQTNANQRKSKIISDFLIQDSEAITKIVGTNILARNNNTTTSTTPRAMVIGNRRSMYSPNTDTSTETPSAPTVTIDTSPTVASPIGGARGTGWRKSVKIPDSTSTEVTVSGNRPKSMAIIGVLPLDDEDEEKPPEDIKIGKTRPKSTRLQK